MVALEAVLIDEMKYSPSMISYYYAFTFLPFMWKPLFAWLSDQVPIGGMHKKPYIWIACFGCAAGYILIGAFVMTSGVLFTVSTLRSTCNAVLALMLDTMVVNIANKDVRQTARLQGSTSVAKMGGGLTAQVIGFIVFAQVPGADKYSSKVPRLLIGCSAIAPVIILFLTRWLPESTDVNDKACVGSPRSENDKIINRKVGLVVALAQANFVMIALCRLLQFQLWIGLTAAVALFSVIILYMCVLRKGELPISGHPLNDVASTPSVALLPTDHWSRKPCRWVGLALFCFLVGCIPNADVAKSQFRYKTFDKMSCQFIGILATVCSCWAAIAFGRGCNRRKTVIMFVVGAVVASLTNLASLMWVPLALQGSLDSSHDILSRIGGLVSGASVLTSFAMMFSLLPIETLVTSVSCTLNSRWRATAYAILMGFWSFGSTAQGFFSANLVELMGLDGVKWDMLPWWIVVTAASNLVVIPLLFLVPRGIDKPSGPDDEDGELELNGPQG